MTGIQKITVTATSSATGRPQRLAKGAGKQRTVSVDLEKSNDWNLGNAAGTLAEVLGWGVTDTITRDGNVFSNTSR